MKSLERQLLDLDKQYKEHNISAWMPDGEKVRLEGYLSNINADENEKYCKETDGTPLMWTLRDFSSARNISAGKVILCEASREKFEFIDGARNAVVYGIARCENDKSRIEVDAILVKDGAPVLYKDNIKYQS